MRSSTKLVLNHKDAVEMGESEMTVSIIDNFWDHLKTTTSTTVEAVALTHVQHSLLCDCLMTGIRT